jgi:uncharacterized protein YpuA (DUF1002 family)
MKGYLAILLIGLISCNTLVTDSSKIEFGRILKLNEAHFKDYIKLYFDNIAFYVGNYSNYLLKFLEQKYYIDIIEKIKILLEQFKEYAKKHSLKEILEKFKALVKELKDFLINIPTEQIEDYVKEILEKVKEYIINADFGPLEPYMKKAKEILKKLDLTVLAKKITEKVEKYKQLIIDFDDEGIIKKIMDSFKQIRESIFDPEKEKKMIEDFRFEVEFTKDEIEYNIKWKGEEKKREYEIIYQIFHDADLSAAYKRIGQYYPIVRMFFLFFDPRQLVKILKEVLIKTKEFAKKIDVEFVYNFLKKVIEFLRIFIGDNYANLLLNYAKDCYDFIKGLPGKIDVDAISDSYNQFLNNVKNYILSHDADYVVNEFKEAWAEIVNQLYSPDDLFTLYKNYTLKLIDAIKKFDDELIINLYKQVLNIIKVFLVEMKKNKFLGF